MTNRLIPIDPKTTSHKTCPVCKETQLRSAFTKDRSRKDGLRYRCKACHRAWQQEHKNAHRDAQRKYAAKPEQRYKKYKDSAASRGFAWLLSRDQFMKHWQKPCTHCGSPIKTIGLDRVDSSKPYQEDNVEPCCRKCNQMKSDWDTVEWYKHLESIRKHAGGFVSASKRY